MDVNILLYASEEASSNHEAALRFLKARATAPELLCMAWSSLFAYLGMATHPSIFVRPLAPDEALQNIEALLSLPRVRVLTEQPGFLDI